MTVRNRVCLWFDGAVADAAKFYCDTFPDTWITGEDKAPSDIPAVSPGDDFAIRMSIMGVPTLLLNGGPYFPQTEAFSFMVETADQTETDRLWGAITGNGGSEGRCGWCKDRWGVSWQIVPRALSDALADPEAHQRVQAAMMGMNKIDIAAIETARRG